MSAGRVPELDWFPKRFTAGDMDGTGSERLLGKTELSPLEVVIRETAQNSWDARLDGAQPEYGVRLRDTDFRLRDDIGRLLGVAGRDMLGGRLQRSDFRLLEIYDRGTCGLDGPADLRPVPKDRPQNYQDLILKVGVPRDDGHGGGTFGFGKTAAYAYSRHGIVIYWTRCRNPEDALEHRFIVSAFRDSYSTKGEQFTGRHWWGIVDGEEILPLVGETAAECGEQLFARGFDGDETGTSMLILDPMADDSPAGGTAGEERFAETACTAVRRHLWPKLIADPGTGRAPMSIHVADAHGEAEPLGSPAGVLDDWAAGLNAIRALRRGSSERIIARSGIPVRVVRIERYKKLLGHLAIVKRLPVLEENPDGDDLDPALPDHMIERIALMRGRTELVVTTENWYAETPGPGMDWVAVYKSSDEMDKAYAECEPPAHDAWIAAHGAGESALIVSHTKRRVTAILREEFEAPKPTARAEGSGIAPTGALAKRLGQMLPRPATEGAGSARARGGHARSGSRRSQKWKVQPTSERLEETFADGRQHRVIEFVVSGPGEEALVTISASLIGEEGVHDLIPSRQLYAKWENATPRAGSGSSALVRVGRRATVRFAGPARRALRIDLEAEAADGRD